MKIVPIVCLLISCVNSQSSENFKSFYEKFHLDSSFQLSRIQFPLEGVNTDSMELDDDVYYWSKEDWKLHKPIDTLNFIVNLTESDTLKVETVETEDQGFFMERRFKLIDKKWYLVYYADVNL